VDCCRCRNEIQGDPTCKEDCYSGKEEFIVRFREICGYAIEETGIMLLDFTDLVSGRLKSRRMSRRVAKKPLDFLQYVYIERLHTKLNRRGILHTFQLDCDLSTRQRKYSGFRPLLLKSDFCLLRRAIGVARDSFCSRWIG
jgi:hypothetical protein